LLFTGKYTQYKEQAGEHQVNQSTSNTPSTDVGSRLRDLREERHISMRELGRLSGISVNALSLIERGLSSPSVGTLYKLVEALGVPIAAIFQSEPHRSEIIFRSAQQRSKVDFPWGYWEGMGGENFVGRMEPFMLVLAGNSDSGIQPIVHTGHEFVMCIQGNLEYRVEGQIFSMLPGDSLLFAARLRHCWRNPGSLEAKAVIVLSGYEEYENPGKYHLP
jgi:transcriptional regulator with XRE-family HTH domain